jgi:hypothetical protein
LIPLVDSIVVNFAGRWIETYQKKRRENIHFVRVKFSQMIWSKMTKDNRKVCILCGRLRPSDRVGSFWPDTVNRFCKGHQRQVINVLVRNLYDRDKPPGEWKRLPEDADVEQFVTYKLKDFVKRIKEGKIVGYCEVDSCHYMAKTKHKGKMICGMHLRRLKEGRPTIFEDLESGPIIEKVRELLEI